MDAGGRGGPGQRGTRFSPPRRFLPLSASHPALALSTPARTQWNVLILLRFPRATQRSSLPPPPDPAGKGPSCHRSHLPQGTAGGGAVSSCPRGRVRVRFSESLTMDGCESALRRQRAALTPHVALAPQEAARVPCALGGPGGGAGSGDARLPPGAASHPPVPARPRLSPPDTSTPNLSPTSALSPASAPHVEQGTPVQLDVAALSPRPPSAPEPATDPFPRHHPQPPTRLRPRAVCCHRSRPSLRGPGRGSTARPSACRCRAPPRVVAVLFHVPTSPDTACPSPSRHVSSSASPGPCSCAQRGLRPAQGPSRWPHSPRLWACHAATREPRSCSPSLAQGLARPGLGGSGWGGPGCPRMGSQTPGDRTAGGQLRGHRPQHRAGGPRPDSTAPARPGRVAASSRSPAPRPGRRPQRTAGSRSGFLKAVGRGGFDS